MVFTELGRRDDGTNGISGVDRPSLPGVGLHAPTRCPSTSPWRSSLAIVMILLYRLQDSRWPCLDGHPRGRAGRRQQRHQHRHDQAAGLRHGRHRPPGFAGVFNASKLVFVSPDQFVFNVSFTVLAMVVLGGMGNIWGVAVGAFVALPDPERLPANSSTSLRHAPRPDHQRHRLPPVPVPALRHRAGGDDAAASGGPVPEPATAARAPRPEVASGAG